MSFYHSLPRAAEPVCISDLHSSLSKSKEGGEDESESRAKNVRVFGRVTHYDPVKEILWLVEPQHPANPRHRQTTTAQGMESQGTTAASTLLVDTSLIGSFDFDCRKGSQVLCVGEIQSRADSRLGEMNMDKKDEELSVVVRATICKLMEGLDYEKYCRYVEVVQHRNSSVTFHSMQ